MSNEVKLEDMQAIIGTLPKYVNSEIREMRGVLERIDYGEAQRAIDILKEMQMVRWIPVTERLPEEGQLVLCWSKACGGAIVFGCRNGDMIFTGLDDEVSHWMPLPNPPEEVKADD